MRTARRDFLKTATSFSLGFLGLDTLINTGDLAAPQAETLPNHFGPLLPDPEGIVDLPKGFTYKIISRAGDEMKDGLFVPGKPDGMAAFRGSTGRTVLVRNHELDASDLALSPFGPAQEKLSLVPRELHYDPGKDGIPALGGTTTMVYNALTKKLESEWLSLAGTVRNCAGGPTPWGSWITCEETMVRKNAHYAKDHGFNFEVPSVINGGITPPIPIKAMGRFNHEAVAVHEESGIVYQTEDVDDGAIYRYIPNAPGELLKGGKLQALMVRSNPGLDTRNWGEHRQVSCQLKLDVRWIDLEDVESPNDDLRYQAFDKGASRFARGEGMWTAENAIYFACTSGGNAKRGQIWKYYPSPAEGTAYEAFSPGRLELFLEPNDGTLINNADNLTVAPWGDIIVCEDTLKAHLVGITPEGSMYKFARNSQSNGEFAGSVFAPDGTTLFVNLQDSGLTLAIEGPWRKGSLT